MKQKKYYSFIWSALPIGLCIIAMSVGSCKRSGDDVPPTDTTSYLNVINVVTDIRAVDFYLNGTRQNNNSAIYLYNSSGYLTVPKGEQQYQLKSDTDRTLLADIRLNPAAANAYYTLVVTGQQSKNNLATIFLNDNFVTNTVATNAQVRFVQASPGTAAYDVFVGDSVSFKNQAFKSSTGFQSVGAGKKTVKVVLAGASTPMLLGTVTLQAGSYYTLLTEGVPGSTGNNAFGVSVNLSR